MIGGSYAATSSEDKAPNRNRYLRNVNGSKESFKKAPAGGGKGDSSSKRLLDSTDPTVTQCVQPYESEGAPATNLCFFVCGPNDCMAEWNDWNVQQVSDLSYPWWTEEIAGAWGDYNLAPVSLWPGSPKHTKNIENELYFSAVLDDPTTSSDIAANFNSLVAGPDNMFNFVDYSFCSGDSYPYTEPYEMSWYFVGALTIEGYTINDFVIGYVEGQDSESPGENFWFASNNCQVTENRYETNVWGFACETTTDGDWIFLQPLGNRIAFYQNYYSAPAVE